MTTSTIDRPAKQPATRRPGQRRNHTKGVRNGDPLTHVEARVLVLVAQGIPNLGIASGTGVNVDTVKTHLRRIFTKLGARDRANAVVLALASGDLVFVDGRVLIGRRGGAA